MTRAHPLKAKPWPDYQAVWRWHFYAGLFCIPFVCFLAVTGAVYLFKPQVEAWLDRPYDRLAWTQTAPPSQAVRVALAANPGWTLHDYQLPRTARSAAQVLVGRRGEERRVYVDRGTLRVLKTVPEEQRLMRLIFHLHGELLLGDRGSMVVELAASWAIVMIITGLYLWWPRQTIGLAGVIYPRLGAGKRLFWRDLHAVTGVWVSVFALFMLASGLPWSANWGGYLKTVRKMVGVASAHQDWTTGRASEITEHKAKDAAGMASVGGMPGMGDMGVGPGRAAQPLAGVAALDRMAPTLAALDLPPPVLISPPSTPDGPWSGRSDTQDRPRRVVVKLDPATGAVISRTDFAQHDLIDRIVGVGVAAHEGQLFGWPNQLLGVLIAISLVAVSISAVVLWWRRRVSGVLGAPAPAGEPRFSTGLAAIVVILGVLLPLFGLSLIIVAVAEWLVLRRVPGVRDWLGLAGATTPG
jgi:uncharacterized iron-regulated membrane protein